MREVIDAIIYYNQHIFLEFNLPSTLACQLSEQIWLLSDFSSTHAQANVLIELTRLLRRTPAD